MKCENFRNLFPVFLIDVLRDYKVIQASISYIAVLQSQIQVNDFAGIFLMRTFEWKHFAKEFSTGDSSTNY